MANKEGLLLTWERKITRLELEIDDQALRYMLENPQLYNDHELAPLVFDNTILLKRNWMVMLMHFKRNDNEAAHILADLGRKMVGDRTYQYERP